MLTVLLALAVGAVGSSTAAFQSSRDGGCSEWRNCRELARAAADRGEYETFHDLAWRAVQTGPPKDPELMYLLARAQSLSGRPHDALIMLERLAQMGLTYDAATSEDFSRTRQLPGWLELQARAVASTTAPATAPAAAPTTARAIAPAVAPTTAPAIAPAVAPTAAPATARTVAPASATAVAPRTAPPAAPSAAPPSAAAAASISVVRPYALAPAPVEEALRFSAERLAVGGLAYDVVSRRFLLGDRLGRKVMVVSEGSNQVIDLVSSESAGFHEVSAIEIDAKRGDLWVASATVADGSGALHRLQLVSGRPLKTFRVSTDLEPVSLVDLAVGPAGAVFVLDSVGQQLLALPSGGTSLERVVRIDAQQPSSVAVGDDQGIAYVSHRDGVSRIDLRARTSRLITAPNGVVLSGLERIRWYRHSLLAVGIDVDGSRRIFHLELNGTGRSVTRATILETPIEVASPTFVISGNELVYLTAGSESDGRRTPGASLSPSEFIAYRVRLP